MLGLLKPVFKQGTQSNKHGTNSKSRTMGVASSRKVLFKPPEPEEGRRDSKWNLYPFFANNRLVRDELREEVQCSIHDQQEHICDSIPLIQESPQGLQQEDVRPFLPMQTDQIQGLGHDSGPAKLFRVGSLRRDYPIPRSKS